MPENCATKLRTFTALIQTIIRLTGKLYFRRMDISNDIEAKNRFRKQVKGLWTFRLFLLLKLPIALVSGLRVRALDEHHCTVSVPFKRLTQNPFRSVYFASQAMAAEMSTGVLCLAAIQGCRPAVSMLVVNLQAIFTKKATGRVFFTCENGDEITAAVATTMQTGEGVTVKCTSIGRLADGTEVSKFIVEWSLKRKSA